MCRSVRGDTLAVSGSNIESVECATQLFVIGSWEVHARPPLLRSMQALAQWLYCASRVLHRPGGALHRRQNPTEEASSYQSKLREI